MDSWLHEEINQEISDTDTDTDLEKEQDELESRLYAVVHHNDLSQPLAPDLAQLYSVESTEDGEVLVALKQPLDEIKLHEDHASAVAAASDDDQTEIKDSDEVIICEKTPEEPQRITKKVRTRYSDVNIDELNEFSYTTEKDLHLFPKNIDFYFKMDDYSREFHKTMYPNIQLPKSFNSSDWKIDSSENFITISSDDKNTSFKKEMIQKMFMALARLNKNVNEKILRRFADVLFMRNKKLHKRALKRKLRKGRKDNYDPKISFNQSQEQSRLSGETSSDFAKHKKMGKREEVNNITNGSVSLNISPFIPDSQFIDLVSDDGKNSSMNTTPVKVVKNLSQSHLPAKWSKVMVKAYSKPAKKELKKDIHEIIENLKNNTVESDWPLDPRDERGVYTSPFKKRPGVRCLNCNERGHMAKECHKATKIPTCTLCGGFFHSVYNCPNMVCYKCGVPSPQGECVKCYFNSFDHDSRCNNCSSATHRSAVCPDFWRKFHATTEGELKIPDKVIENKRKYCCNCSRKGHFSHNCPFFTHSGHQISVFVSNYSATPHDQGTSELLISDEYADIVNSDETDSFLQSLSDYTKAVIGVDSHQNGIVIKITGTFEQCHGVKNEIESYINTRKRKREEPFTPKRKKRRRHR